MTSNQPNQQEKFPKVLARCFDPSRCQPQFVADKLWLTLILAGSWLMPYPAIADSKLPPPPIFDDEPPSQPNSPSMSPPGQLPSAPLNQVPPNRQLEFEAPLPGKSNPRTSVPGGQMYEVDVYGDSPLLLAQIQKIVPDAFVRHRDRIIQAGIFVEQSNAVDRVRLLEAQGIKAKIQTVATRVSNSPSVASDYLTVAGNTPTPTTSNFPTVVTGNTPIPTTSNFPTVATGNIPTLAPGNTLTLATRDAPNLTNAYFVVIPGSQGNLDHMASQLIRLGVNREAVWEKEGPRGPHIAVGPFEKRGQAERWSSYLRSAGMDARVYFGR